MTQTILIADDHTSTRTLLVRLLSEAGYHVIEASNGVEAVERALETHPSLILMDMQMPLIDGLAAARQIRSDPRLINTRIIAMTALVLPDDRARYATAGISASLRKPVHLPDLLRLLEATAAA